MAAIEIRNLTKVFGDLVAVDKLDLDIRKGEVYGLLGPNGAGKTTVIRVLVGLASPWAGKWAALTLPSVSDTCPRSLHFTPS
jgi:ABC-2 type transport system ATP-binding protein